MSDKPIARLPVDCPEDEWCSICGDDNMLVVLDGMRTQGTKDIVMDSINLCPSCYGRMKGELEKLNLGQ